MRGGTGSLEKGRGGWAGLGWVGLGVQALCCFNLPTPGRGSSCTGSGVQPSVPECCRQSEDKDTARRTGSPREPGVQTLLRGRFWGPAWVFQAETLKGWMQDGICALTPDKP